MVLISIVYSKESLELKLLCVILPCRTICKLKNENLELQLVTLEREKKVRKKKNPRLIVCDKRFPSGIQSNDLDAYIKFDFLYPSSVRGVCSSQPPRAAHMAHTSYRVSLVLK